LTDWRAFLVFFGFWPPPRHSWVHTYLGSFFSALVFASAMLYLRPKIRPLLKKIGVDSEFSSEKIFYTALSGVTVHVTLDAFHHPSMNPFYPIMNKPLYGYLSSSETTLFALLLCLAAIPVYAWHLAGRPTNITHIKKTSD
jgi:membrane-bound metal-dependent hydrolase YbcI (DUF457 family)